MKTYIYLAILITLFSCKENKIEVQEKQNVKKIGPPKIDYEIREIGQLYRPEMMQQEEIKNGNGKNNYRYTLTNSDLLDQDLQNIQIHSRKIALNYYNFLIKINSPFNYEKIIVKIVHRNGKIDSFEYSEKEIKEIMP
ncbi:hypothetical protein [Flavobacterium sp. ASV13]|uniref:hypothetical protein n=1 Tax=Flavobacterium sp. ASV13 TaxID=1506583 RepID=UPI0005540178|nr:hypothetical protein [Flavobacterium sp. ASV13]